MSTPSPRLQKEKLLQVYWLSNRNVCCPPPPPPPPPFIPSRRKPNLTPPRLFQPEKSSGEVKVEGAGETRVRIIQANR